VQCPHCPSPDTRVVDSRPADDGASIRRRRECTRCGRRFTTFERFEGPSLVVTKRSGRRVPFVAAKVVAGVTAACKGRPVGDASITELASDVESMVRASPGMSTEQVGRAVLDRLRCLDQVAYLRFASVYKGFDNADDFLRELQLLEAAEPPGR